MKLLVIFAALTAHAALAQTVTPAGTVPGPKTVVTPDMRNAGSPRASRRDMKVPGLSHHDQKRMRKMSKVKSNPDGTIKRNY